MTDIINIPIIGEFVRLRRPALKDVPASYITLLIVDSMNGTLDENLNFYNGIKFPFKLDGVMYSFFADDVIKNFGKITVNELIETYPEYLL